MGRQGLDGEGQVIIGDPPVPHKVNYNKFQYMNTIDSFFFHVLQVNE